MAMLKFRQRQVVRGVRLICLGSVAGCIFLFSIPSRAVQPETNNLLVTAAQSLAAWLASTTSADTNHAPAPAQTNSSETAITPQNHAAVEAAAEKNVVAAEVANPLFPDAKRLNALGMIETGNDDRGIGGMGEISRYQIQPAIWKNYSKSDDYWNPEVSEEVARLHWAYLVSYFKQKTGREPTDFDIYVMWNTRLGYYSAKGFSPSKISPVVQDRAQRFVNLVNRKKYPGEL
jgi:hypothetical protein